MEGKENPSELVTNDLGIKDSEIMQPIETSVTGKVLSEGWLSIVSAEEEQKAYQALQDPREDRTQPPTHQPIDRLSYTLRNGNKELRYLAVQHTFGRDNRNHPQFSALKANFDRYKPQIVLYEGPHGSPTAITEEDAYIHGEKAYIQYLVLEHNKNLQSGEQPTVMESCDMQPLDEVKEYQKRGYTNEEIAAAEILRWIYYEYQGLMNTSGLTDEQRSQRIEELQAKYEANPLTPVLPEFFSWVPRRDGQQWNAELVKAEIERQTGHPLRVDFNYLALPRFKQMFDESREFRDRHIVKKIAEAGRKYDRVMVIMGSAHAIRGRRALEQFYEAEAGES